MKHQEWGWVMRIKQLLITFCALVVIALQAVYADDWDDWEDEFEEDEIARLVAPIALYPDAVVSQILIAATYPLEVVEAARWVQAHPNYKSKKAVRAASKQGWDPSVQSLVAFPELLVRMSKDLRWLQKLGEAFLADEAKVLAVIQDLRRQADQAGRLDEFENVVVVREPTKRIIVIEPRHPDVIFLPYYDPHFVFAGWNYYYDPIVWYPPHHHYFVRPIFWTPGFSISFSLFWTGIHWHHHRIVVWRQPRHIYRYRDIRRVRIGTEVTVWRHNPIHRRGAIYRTPRLRAQYRLEQHAQPTRRLTHPVRTTTIRRPASRVSTQAREIPTRNAITPPRPRHHLERREQIRSSASRPEHHNTRPPVRSAQPRVHRRDSSSRQVERRSERK